MDKKIIQADHRPKVFSIETYHDWKIEEINHEEVHCIDSYGNRFQFSIGIDRCSFRSEFTCIYITSKGQGTVIYRAEPTEHVKDFWNDLLNEHFKRTSGERDILREKVLKEFNFNWEGENK